MQKCLFIKDLKPQDIIRSTFLVRSKQVFVARNAKPYLALILADRTGEVDCRVWENASELSNQFTEGDVVAVSGRAHQFQNRLQLVVGQMCVVPSDEIDPGDYLPKYEHNLDKLFTELLGKFETMENPWIRRVSLALLQTPDIAERFKVCPAAKTIHHAFIGGLLVHVMSVIRLVEAVVPLYTDIDKDLLIFGATFHDFGKIYELSYGNNFDYTDEGRLVGHITIGVNLLDREIRKIADFPKDIEYQLKHLILSHHGRLDYGSPKKPHTIEAEVLHALDDMDSKINSIQTLMHGDRNAARWTTYHKAYDNYYYKPDKYVSADV